MYTRILAGALSALVLAGSAQAQSAFSTTVVVEDPVAGFVGPIPTSQPPIMVASDGESPFQPFGLTFDVSDAIMLNADWAPDPGYASAFGVNGWQQVPETYIWYLIACPIVGVCENGDVVEPIGKWYFTPGSGWAAGTQNLLITDSEGEFSDFVGVANDGPNGAATITFQSGGAVPEPATWAMMLLGFGGIGFAMRRRNQRPALAQPV